ncbi:protein of unknown function [Chitinophaga jiangningensis]|uniref:DUF4268 domain-containing protein n=1 Tax=Chitinophaga jiangningensis TaxID=1419482 RepID=A0A1M7BZA0_9BACT|nr:DUF4268 domain-containing protein [Chitinophaga jiangningensis]SHL60300.1 protein of unknown function [Chitinophaga jiangningensis]
MYSKQEVSTIKQAFWTAFGKYMKPILSADGEFISWSNYKTGIPGVSFKLEADNKTASVTILITQADAELHLAFYEQFELQKNMLEATLEESDWDWQFQATDDYGKHVSYIRKELQGVSVLRQEDWPALISFFKSRIIKLDEYWSSAKYGFEMLL